MLEISTNKREVAAPSAPIEVTVEKSGSSTAPAVTVSKNASVDAQKIATYVESVKNSTVIDPHSPELTPPIIPVADGGAMDAVTLNEFLAKLVGEVSGESPVDMKGRLEEILQKQVEKAAEENARWKSFETDANNFSTALGRLEKVIASFDAPKAAPGAEQPDMAAAEQEALEAWTMLNQAMKGLNNIFPTLSASSDPKRTALFDEVAMDSNERLTRILYALHSIMQENKLTLLQMQSDLSVALQDAMTEKLTEQTKKFTEEQAKRDTFAEIGKWFAIIMLGAMELVLSGGTTGGMIVALVTTAIMTIDMTVLDNKLSDTIMKPIIEPITKALEPVIQGFVDVISNAMIAAGIDEATAKSVALAVVVVTVAVVIAAVAVVAVKSGAAKLVIEGVQTIIAGIQAFLGKIIETVIPTFIREGVASAIKGLDTLLGEAMEWIFQNVFRIDAKSAAGYIQLEKIAYALKWMQSIFMVANSATTGAIQSTAAKAGKNASEISAEMDIVNTDYKLTARQFQDAEEQLRNEIPMMNKNMKTASELIESMQQTLTAITRHVVLRV